jgi:hypothetical protein
MPTRAIFEAAFCCGGGPGHVYCVAPGRFDSEEVQIIMGLAEPKGSLTRQAISPFAVSYGCSHSAIQAFACVS